jgi:hypothetical protein
LAVHLESVETQGDWEPSSPVGHDSKKPPSSAASHNGVAQRGA